MGDKGIQLSGGQVLPCAYAHTYPAAPTGCHCKGPLAQEPHEGTELMLDEATSAPVSQSEALVHEALERYRARCDARLRSQSACRE